MTLEFVTPKGSPPSLLHGDSALSKLTLDELADEANAGHQEALSGVKMTVAGAVRAGRAIREAKEKRLKHGEYEKWVRTNCSFSTVQAWRYMQAAARVGNLSPEEDLNASIMGLIGEKTAWQREKDKAKTKGMSEADAEKFRHLDYASRDPNRSEAERQTAAKARDKLVEQYGKPVDEVRMEAKALEDTWVKQERDKICGVLGLSQDGENHPDSIWLVQNWGAIWEALDVIQYDIEKLNHPQNIRQAYRAVQRAQSKPKQMTQKDAEKATGFS